MAQIYPEDNYGITRINIDGKNLMLGNGFHIIGSKTGSDNDDNIDSESPYNTNGLMKSRNANFKPLPYSLKFTKDAKDPYKVSFTMSVGPSADSYASLSIPLECKMQYFNYFRSSNSSIQYYDQNRLAYTTPIGNYYIESAPGSPQWGEIIGTQYTIRVTLNSTTRTMPLGFVNAPNLSTGDRDVEFGFSGGLPAGKTATVSGVIQVYRTDPNTIHGTPTYSVSSPYHQVGRPEGDGWSAKVTDSPRPSFLQYGPYLVVAPWAGVSKNASSFPAGDHSATFRLMLDNVIANNDKVMTIDIYDAASGQTIVSQDLTRKMFTNGAFQYSDFTLYFTTAPNQRIECRTYWRGNSYVRQHSVTLR